MCMMTLLLVVDEACNFGGSGTSFLYRHSMEPVHLLKCEFPWLCSKGCWVDCGCAPISLGRSKEEASRSPSYLHMHESHLAFPDKLSPDNESWELVFVYGQNHQKETIFWSLSTINRITANGRNKRYNYNGMDDYPMYGRTDTFTHIARY